MKTWIWLPISFGIFYLLWKVEQIAERLRVISAILQDWDRKKYPEVPDGEE